jgi:hypothetical protein
MEKSYMDDVIKDKAPSYTCHKRVKALEIRRVGSYCPSPHDSSVVVRPVVFVETELQSVYLPAIMFDRYTPEPGDFLVIYEDGYQSFSPRKAFLEGYAKDGESFAGIKKRIGRAPHASDEERN